MFSTIMQKVNAQRERGTLIQHITKENDARSSAEEQARVMEQEEAFNRELLIAGLTGTTAVIHIYLGGTLFVLNGVGFLDD